GGKAAYPSSVLMNAIPARVAGVEEVVMAVPTPRGEVNELVLAAAFAAGVHRGYAVGGAQAVAALAFGAGPIPRVDKIVGPGNAYVAEAKRQVFGQVGIDMIAGPSEIVVVADGGDPRWLAADLLSQAEHDEDAQAVFITTELGLAEQVRQALDALLERLSRRAIAAKALAERGALIVVQDWAEAVELVNRIAPEHLELAMEDPELLLPYVRHAGAIFLGPYTPETIGDYIGGPNHVLPTSGTARFSSGLSVDDFVKKTTLLRATPEGLRQLGPAAAHLAHREGLDGHALAVEIRLQSGEME
ncbi:MAG: histidinol dehydrogenase, partial [Zetaproteobacteria bacterium]